MITVNAVKCPTCGADEMHPDGDKLLIRAFKFLCRDNHWWSQCLVCCGAYDENLVYDEEKYDPEKGWF